MPYPLSSTQSQTPVSAEKQLSLHRLILANRADRNPVQTPCSAPLSAPLPNPMQALCMPKPLLPFLNSLLTKLTQPKSASRP